MNTSNKLVPQIIRDEEGANLVEYIILLGVVALICIGAFSLFGDSIQDKITEQRDTLDNVNSTSGAGGP